jgi:hypothetical protein
MLNILVGPQGLRVRAFEFQGGLHCDLYQEAATIDALSLAAFYELPRIPVMRSSRGFPPLFPNTPVRTTSEESTLAALLRLVGLPGWSHPPRLSPSQVLGLLLARL